MTVYSAGLTQRPSLEQSSSRSISHDCLATGFAATGIASSASASVVSASVVSASTGSASTGSWAWRRLVMGLAAVCWVMMWGVNLPAGYAAEQRLAALFLGDQGHHQPKARFDQLQPVLAARGIDLTYTSALTDLNSETLAHYPVLILYANIDEIGPEQARALLDYVAQGGGFVPLHCASYCFRNNPDVVALMGAQFQRHGTGTFRTQPAEAEHPVMRGFGGFESWDETYVHHLHNEKDRTVLEYRVDSEGREPWTWVRTHGEGRVFYTAWGHDQRTWSKPGFHNLVERGIRWAAKQDPELAGQFRDAEAFPVPQMTELQTDVAPFEFQDVGAKIPNYTPGQQWGTQGAPLTKMQLPLPAEESIKHFVTPQGFHVELFISEPMLEGKPICMTWDERGRLWVAETYDYPNELQPPGKGRDRIRICEDTDGDGKADKTTVFADKLSIPTSIAFSRGGVIIQDGMNTLYLKDTNGDDQADQREVLFSGWGMGDTHGGVSNFQYGLDNWVWGMQGYNDSSPVVKGEPQQSFRQGFFRFRPDGSQLEFIRSTNNNTWGLGISEEGIIFGSTANRNPSVYMPIPNRFYERVRGWTPSMVLDTIADTYLFKAIRPDIRQVDQHGGYTAGAGHALYTARSYPQEYWNRTAFVTEPTGHLVGTFVLNRHGSDYKSTSPFNLLASNDEWSAPIMAEVGPDGSVWVLDWYNYIVQHNPTPHGFETGKGNAYETDLRDKKHGRVYRVVYDGGAKHAPLNLAQASPAELVAALKHPTMLWRKHAQRLLVERGELDVVPQLIALVQDQQVDPVGLNVGAIHALWTLEGLQALQDLQGPAGKAAVGALRHPSAGVRRNAVQVLPPSASSVAAILQAGVLADADAQVQLASLLALAEQPALEGEEVGALLVQRAQATDLPTDRWSSDALVAAAATHHAAFLRSAVTVSQPSRRLEETMRVVVGHWVRSQPDPQLLTSLLKSATDNPSPLTTALVDGLADNWQANQPLTLSEEFEGALERLVPKVPAATQGRLVYLAKLWHSDRLDSYGQQITDQLLEQVADAARSAEERATAAQQLIEFSGDDASTTARLLELITPATEPELANQLLRTMSGARHDQAGQQLIERLNQLTPGLRTAVFSVLLSRPAMTRALLEATRDGQVQVDDLPLDQRQALLTHPDRALRRLAEEVFRNAVGLPSADRKAVLEEWLPVASKPGSVEAGALVFRQQCAKCHMYRQEGNRIGPELTGMAVHPKSELLTNILDPSRSVEGNFRLYTVVTNDGRVLSGMLAAESRTTVEIFDAEGKRQTILRSDVDQLVGSSKSLMPEGFEKQISQQQMADLLAFLTQRGKYVPLDLAKVATISSARGMFFSPDSPIERMIFSDWSPKTFHDIPFSLVDPLDGRRSNAILLYGPEGTTAPKMPRSVEMPCETEAVAIHFLSGVSGWGHPNGRVGDVSLIVRIHYQDQQTEDHALKNGEHFADYIRRVDVPKSEFAFDLDGRQLRYFSVKPGRAAPIAKLELVKGSDRSAPIVMAITVETATAAGK